MPVVRYCEREALSLRLRRGRLAAPPLTGMRAQEIYELSGRNAYVGYAAPRYSVLLSLLDRLLQDRDKTVLDIGRTFLSELVASRLARPVTTLGFGSDAATSIGMHYEFDLNDAQEEVRWRRDIAPHDVVIMAEVIEHLYTSPDRVLAFLYTLVKPGGRLILQTPNAVALGRRIAMLLGRNPFELIREDRLNPGHFREYTAGELMTYAIRHGFSVERIQHIHYFDMRFAADLQANRGRARTSRARLLFYLHRSGVTNLLYRALPPKLQTGINMVLKKTG
jgi:2-polyprenyl-3-methyl-5-hydroxy-6-metoxy-1,4-benzoquinol methylase